MKPSSYDIPLHDIKPLMEVPDSSFVILGTLLAFAALLLSGALYLLYRFAKKRRQINIRKLRYEALVNIDFDDPKRAAYAITEYGRTFAGDSDRLREAYANLVGRLAQYKYKRRVEPIDEESRSYYKIYLGMIDV